MRFLFGFLLLTAAAVEQAGPRLQSSHTTESLRGVSVVSRQIAWASGTHGTYLRTTDGGRSWTAGQVPDASALDFRAVVGFSADEAFLMSAGPAEGSRIYHTSDAGRHWVLRFTNTNPKGFFDAMVFWDPRHGVVLGDPVPDASGKLRFEVLLTEDGEHWRVLQSVRMPTALEGEGAFAASNSCLAILAPGSDPNIWFATGGKVARVFHSGDRGETWQALDTPVAHGLESAGIFSITFRDAEHGVVVGGDYQHPDADGPNLAFTDDGGRTWNLAAIHPQVYFSSVVYEPRSEAKVTNQTGARFYLVGQDSVFDFRPPDELRRIPMKKSLAARFNAASAYPEGGALVVGSKGVIASLE
jgi:photosystem II stability/assembly factor-like uncharacterized protein